MDCFKSSIILGMSAMAVLLIDDDGDELLLISGEGETEFAVEVEERDFLESLLSGVVGATTLELHFFEYNGRVDTLAA